MTLRTVTHRIALTASSQWSPPATSAACLAGIAITVGQRSTFENVCVRIYIRVMRMHDGQTIASEWIFKGDRNGYETAVIRRIDFGSRQTPETWFRVVTYSPTSEERELIGWCKTMDAAQSVAWDYSCAIDSWHQAHASGPQMGAWNHPPPAPDLVRAYREAARERPGDDK